MEQGWIKLHRSIYNHWLWKEDTKLKWWLDLLLMANHTTRKILLGNQLFEIPRGSLHTSVTKLTARWQADKKTVKRFLDLLQKDSMISYTTTSKGTTINISNYNDFQDSKKVESQKDAPALSPEEGPAASPPPTPEVTPTEGTVSSTTAASASPSGQDPALSTLNPLESPHCGDAHMDNGMDTPMGTCKDIPGDIPKGNTVDKLITMPKDITVDKPITIHKDISVDNTITIPMDITGNTTVVNLEVSTKDTNNNVNNNKNLNNANTGEEGEEWKKEILCPSTPKTPLSLESPEDFSGDAAQNLPPLSFPTPLHKEIHNTLGDIAYRTWFMDADIASTEGGATLKVDSPFKRDVINTKFRVQLGRILGKIVEVKSA